MTPLKPIRLAALLAGVVLPAVALTGPATAADLDVTGISAPAEYQSPWQIRVQIRVRALASSPRTRVMWMA